MRVGDALIGQATDDSLSAVTILANRLLRSIGGGAAMGLCAVLSGCSGNAVTVWSAESTSPNGDWVAQAHTLQSSGFGAAAVGTGVYLKRTQDSRESIQVLGLSNNSAYPVGVTSVKLKWVNNSHLDVTYGMAAKLNFQEAMVGDVVITAHRN